MHSFIIAITTFTAYLLILTIDIVPYQLENHLLIVILSIESIVSIHSLQLYAKIIPRIIKLLKGKQLDVILLMINACYLVNFDIKC